MTKDDLDKMWGQALNESIKNNEEFTRYRFAKLVAAIVAEREREECAKFIESTDLSSLPAQTMRFYALLLKEIVATIRARGNK